MFAIYLFQYEDAKKEAARRNLLSALTSNKEKNDIVKDKAGLNKTEENNNIVTATMEDKNGERATTEQLIFNFNHDVSSDLDFTADCSDDDPDFEPDDSESEKLPFQKPLVIMEKKNKKRSDINQSATSEANDGKEISVGKSANTSDGCTKCAKYREKNKCLKGEHKQLKEETWNRIGVIYEFVESTVNGGMDDNKGDEMTRPGFFTYPLDEKYIVSTYCIIFSLEIYVLNMHVSLNFCNTGSHFALQHKRML